MNRLLGYARVSTQDQHLELQIDALTKYGVGRRDIFRERITGSKKDRPELERLLQYVQPGDLKCGQLPFASSNHALSSGQDTT